MMHWLRHLFELIQRSILWRVYGYIWKVIDVRNWRMPSFRKLVTPSLPFLVAIGVLVFLSIALAIIVVYNGSEISFGHIWLLAGIVIAISISAAVCVVAFRNPTETFDDIRESWESGVAELRRNRIYLNEVPLFLILGAESTERAKDLLKASRLIFDVRHGEDAGPLFWCANQDVIILACNKVSCLSRISRSHLEEMVERAVGQAPRNQGAVDIFQTAWPGEEPAAAPAEVNEVAGAGWNAPSSSMDALKMTAVVPLGGNWGENGDGDAAIPYAADGPAIPVLRREDAATEEARLAYLAKLIKDARSPLAPINGVMTLLSRNLILGDTLDGARIRDAVKRDLKTLTANLELRFPVFAVINGWEHDDGFRALIHRLPGEMVTESRMGKGAKDEALWAVPTKKRMANIGRAACNSIEAFIYHLYAKPDAITKTTNRALFSLLCKMRRHLRPRLEYILAEGFGVADPEQSKDEASLFGGCYFVAAGKEEGTRAFVPSTFDRMLSSAMDLAWTPSALRQDRRNWKIAWIAATSAVAFFVLIVATLIWSPRA